MVVTATTTCTVATVSTAWSAATATTTLDGGAGADILAGGAGNDTYDIDATDSVVEAVGAGVDTVIASRPEYRSVFAGLCATSKMRLYITTTTLPTTQSP